MKNVFKNIIRILIFSPLGVGGVFAQYVPNATSYQYPGIKTLNALQPPTGCGAPSAANVPDVNQAALYFDKCAGKWWGWDVQAAVWKELVGAGSTGGLHAIYNSTGLLKVNDSTLGLDTTFTDARYLQNGLIDGGVVTWSGTGLTFNVTAANYVINKIKYTSAAGSITLNTADATNPRYDVIAVDNTGAIIKITGTPAVNPVIPQVNPNTQLLLTSVYLPAGAVIPPNINQNIIYDENTEVYTGAAGNGLPVIFNQSTVVYHGAVAINAGASSTFGDIDFTRNSGQDTASKYGTLTLFVKLKLPFDANTLLTVYFYKDNTPISQSYTLKLNNNDVTNWQNISIPISSFSFINGLSSAFNKIKIRALGNNQGFYLDYIQFQSGLPPVTQETDPVATQKTITVNGSTQKLNDNPSFTVSSGNTVKAPVGYTLHGTGVGVYQDSIIYKDTVNYRVGINTVLPTSLLDVYPTFPGTVSVANGSTAVTGTGTRFQDQFRNGDQININSVASIVLSVQSQTSLTLSSPFTGGTVSGVPYYNFYSVLGAFSVKGSGDIRQYGKILSRNLASSQNPNYFSTSYGLNALSGLKTGANNAAFGYGALQADTTGNFNTAIGINALNLSNGDGNTALGYNTLKNNTTGQYNTALSYGALALNTTGNYNIGLGAGTLETNTTGSDNIGLGYNVLDLNTTGGDNIGMGLYALNSNTTGNANIGIGYTNFRFLTGNSNNNIAVGYGSAVYAADASTRITTLNNSTFLGVNATPLLNADNNETGIGYNIVGNGSNTTTLGNANVTDAYINGTLRSTGEKKATVTKNSNYTLTTKDQVILANATSGAFAITLPTAVGNGGQQFTVKKIDASANAVTVNTSASQTIDGNTNNVLSTQNASVTAVSDGANWKITGGGSSSGGGGGTVTSFSKTDNWGILSSVTNPTTTPVHAVGVDSATLSGKYLRITDTAVLLRKNTAASIGYDNGEQAYTGTFSNWVGTTPPSGTLTASYRWMQVGKNVTVYLWAKWATTGTNITGFDATIPADLPLPAEPTPLNAVGDVMYSGVANLTGLLIQNGKAGIVKTGTGTYKFQVAAQSASSLGKTLFTINYMAQ
jgi:hypothetical protein